MRERVIQRFDIGQIKSPHGKEIARYETDTKKVLDKYLAKKEKL
jgi:hypothetical protein